jgi:thiosulfate/3-mercaptopyruvate sulfurtransferase
MQLLDTRSPAEYDGTESRAARGGHIPGAVLLPWNELTDDAGRYLHSDAKSPLARPPRARRDLATTPAAGAPTG